MRQNTAAKAAKSRIPRLLNAAGARNMFRPARRNITAIRTRGEPRVRTRPIPVLRFNPLLTDSPPARIR